jgi:hypothetical protein
MKQDEPTKKLVSSRPYRGFSLKDVATRKGSLDILKNPSIFGNTLRYPDGNEVLLQLRDVQESGSTE